MCAHPNAEYLLRLRRIAVLFGDAPASPVPDPPDGSPYSVAAQVQLFDIEIPDRELAPRDPAEAAAAWLNTPNPTFGGLCPQNFLNGTDDQRAFLDGVLSSLEDGAFS